MSTTPKPKPGRPGTPPDKWNAVVDIKESGGTPKQAQDATSLSTTKVYEIWRNPIRRIEAPRSEPAAGQ